MINLNSISGLAQSWKENPRNNTSLDDFVKRFASVYQNIPKDADQHLQAIQLVHMIKHDQSCFFELFLDMVRRLLKLLFGRYDYKENLDRIEKKAYQILHQITCSLQSAVLLANIRHVKRPARPLTTINEQWTTQINGMLQNGPSLPLSKEARSGYIEAAPSDSGSKIRIPLVDLEGLELRHLERSVSFSALL